MGGVDVIFMGTTDLSQNIDILWQVRHREILERIDRVIKAYEARGMAFGIPTSNSDWYQKGIRFHFASSDIDLIVTRGSKTIADFREAVSLSP